MPEGLHAAKPLATALEGLAGLAGPGGRKAALDGLSKPCPPLQSSRAANAGGTTWPVKPQVPGSSPGGRDFGRGHSSMVERSEFREPLSPPDFRTEPRA